MYLGCVCTSPYRGGRDVGAEEHPSCTRDTLSSSRRGDYDANCWQGCPPLLCGGSRWV